MEDNSVWKYHLPRGAGHKEIQVPRGAQPLMVQVQDGVPCMWMLVDPAAARTTYVVSAFGTGDALNPSLTRDRHIGSYLLTSGEVYHVFGWFP